MLTDDFVLVPTTVPDQWHGSGEITIAWPQSASGGYITVPRAGAKSLGWAAGETSVTIQINREYLLIKRCSPKEPGAVKISFANRSGALRIAALHLMHMIGVKRGDGAFRMEVDVEPDGTLLGRWPKAIVDRIGAMGSRW